MKKLTLFWRLYLSVCATMLVVAFAIIGIMQSYLDYDGNYDFARDARRETAPLLHRLQKDSVDEAWLQQFIQDSFFSVRVMSAGSAQALIVDGYLGEEDGVQIYTLSDQRMQARLPAAKGLVVIVEDPIIQEQEFIGHDEGEQPRDEDYIENNAYSVMIALTLLGMALVIFLITKALDKPIKNLQRIQLKFAGGQRDIRAEEDSPSPVNGLAKNFNLMADQIQTQIKDQQVMTHAIAHELRTPLTRMQMALGILSAKADSYTEQQQALLSDLDGYIEEMDKLTNTVLTLGKVQQQDLSELEAIDADSLVQQRIDALRREGERLWVDLQSQAMLKILPMHLQLLVDNLVKNAQRYGDKQVCVVSYVDKDDFVLSVSDDGEGVDENKRQEIFTAFARLDNSRSRETGGFGLGLAIVESIARRYQGEISVERSELGGARFVCRLGAG